MRVAVFVLAALVFLAGLILDTSALFTLIGELLWQHAAATALIALVVIAPVVGWRRLPEATAPRQPRPAAANSAPAKPKPTAKLQQAGKPRRTDKPQQTEKPQQTAKPQAKRQKRVSNGDSGRTRNGKNARAKTEP